MSCLIYILSIFKLYNLEIQYSKIYKTQNKTKRLTKKKKEKKLLTSQKIVAKIFFRGRDLSHLLHVSKWVWCDFLSLPCSGSKPVDYPDWCEIIRKPDSCKSVAVMRANHKLPCLWGRGRLRTAAGQPWKSNNDPMFWFEQRQQLMLLNWWIASDYNLYLTLFLFISRYFSQCFWSIKE